MLISDKVEFERILLHDTNKDLFYGHQVKYHKTIITL